MIGALSPVLRTIFDAIESAANAGERCPKNDVTAEALGLTSISFVSERIAKLEKLGLITVERGQCTRAVTIVATGKRTAGDVSIPHWRHRQRPPQREVGSRGRVAAPREERNPIVLPVDREPCRRCGTRGDVGCRHRPLAMGPL